MSIKSAIAALSLKVKIIIACTVIAVAGGITAAVVLTSGGTDAYRVLKVFELTGSAVISREGAGDIDAYVGMNLESGDTLTVGEDSTLRLSLDGDKYVLLDSGTVLELIAEGTPNDSRTSILLKQGTILNELTTSLSANSSYEVSTPKATMAVRGTSFMVSVEQDEDGSYIIRTNTFHGKVQVILLDADGNPTDETAMVSEGKGIIIKTEPNSETGNPAEVDGTSYFVYETEEGVFINVIKPEDPVNDIVYDYIAAAVKEYALRSSEDGTLVLSDFIISKLKGEAAAPSLPESEEETSATTSAPVTEEEITTTTTAPAAVEADAVITTTVPTYAEETSMTTTVPAAEEAAVTTAEPEAAETTEETTSTTVTSPKDETVTTTTAPETETETEITTTVPQTESETETTTTTTAAPDTESATTTAAPISGYRPTVTTAPQYGNGPTTTPSAPVIATPTYTVSFIGNDGEVYHEEVVEGSTLSDMPNVPSIDGHSGKWMYNGEEFSADTPITSNMTITAEYSALSYTVSYVLSADSSYEITHQTVEYGSVPPTPTLPIVLENGGKKYYLYNWTQPADAITGETTISVSYADYDSVLEVMITDADGVVDHYLAKVGESVTLPNTAADMEGYEFVGWGSVTSGGYSYPDYKVEAEYNQPTDSTTNFSYSDEPKYKPGQTVTLTQNMRMDDYGGNYKFQALYRRFYTVTFIVNGIEVGSAKVYENDTIPAGYLNGSKFEGVTVPDGQTIVWKKEDDNVFDVDSRIYGDLTLYGTVQ
ncbi:MAG: FecR domain-containing protein [Oscillospiraceae bacterium]|nr:FecR domain-containing protein [Oscillospiraceae bacterium]